MGIRRLRPAYDLARESATSCRFAPDWQLFLNDKVGLETLLGSADGPEAAHGPRIDTLEPPALRAAALRSIQNP